MGGISSQLDLERGQGLGCITAPAADAVGADQKLARMGAYDEFSIVSPSLFSALEDNLLDWEKQWLRPGLPQDWDAHQDFALSLNPEAGQISRIIQLMICEGSKNNAAALLYSLSRLTNETANFTPFQGASSARHWHRDRENLCSQHLSNLLQSLQKAKEIILESCYPEELALLRSDYVFAKKTDWVIRFGGDVTFLNEKLKGPIFIQYLLKHQGREIHVARMLADIAGDERLAQASYAGKVSDQTAIQKCRQEYEDLLEAKTEATRTNDVIRLGEIEGEISKLASYLAYCVGLGNRVRNAQDNVSKIRKRIFNVIERAFAKIAKNDPKLEIHLRSFIKTHTYMSYMPDKGIDWNFE